jgi:hypothetical protein
MLQKFRGVAINPFDRKDALECGHIRKQTLAADHQNVAEVHAQGTCGTAEFYRFSV